MTTELIQWEYGVHRCRKFQSSEKEKEYLDLMGKSRWELTLIKFGSVIHKYYFKRPIIQSPDKQEP